MKLLFLLFFLSLSPLMSQEKKIDKDPLNFYDNLSLKGGMSFYQGVINAEGGSEKHLFSYGVNTQFSYLYKATFEINLNAYIFLGKAKGLRYYMNNLELFTDGSYYSFFFSPNLKYITEYTLKKNWHLYFAIGPAWAMQSHKLLPYRDQEMVEKRKHQINLSSSGALFGIGLQEMLPFKTMNPVYIELIAAYLKTRQKTLVDSSDFKEVSKVTKEDHDFHAFDSFIMLNFGITLF